MFVGFRLVISYFCLFVLVQLGGGVVRVTVFTQTTGRRSVWLARPYKGLWAMMLVSPLNRFVGANLVFLFSFLF